MSATQPTGDACPYDVVILGAGYAGLMAALRLGRRKWRLRIALVNAHDQFVERVRLQETIVAAVPPRIPSISALVAGTTIEFICGAVLRSAPVARAAGLATDPLGRIFVDPGLRSISHAHILAVGDAAHPIAPTGAPYRRSAFAALVSGAHAADAIWAQRTKRHLQPFSFSTFGQGVAIGRGGVGFFSYPDDRQTLFILEGRAARHVRNYFVWLVSSVLKLERKLPGFFFWPGRRRVSWHQADDAMRKIGATRKVRAA